MGENIDDIGLIGQIHHQAQRLAHAATARQVGRRHRVKSPIGAQHQEPVRGFSVEDEFGPIPILELELAGQVDMPRHRPDPPHLRADHGDRLFVDHGFDRHLFEIASLGKCRATGTAVKILAEFLLGLAQLIGDLAPLQIV